MKYFVEERQFDGIWKPAVYHNYPPTSRAEGGRIEYRFKPVIVPDFLQQLTLDQLRELLSPDGKFFNTSKGFADG